MGNHPLLSFFIPLISTLLPSVLFHQVSGFHQGILRLAMEPSLLGTAFIEGGPDRKIKLDRSPGIDEVACQMIS